MSSLAGDEGEDLGYASASERMSLDGFDDGLTQQDRFDIFMPAVQSLVNALGGYEEVEIPLGSGKYETIYRPGDSVLAVLKDLKKLWRKDDSDDERTVARCMHKAGLMRELLALMTEMTDRGDWGRKVALIACDLIAALTWPIDVMKELKEMDDEPDLVTDYASLLRAQREYKAMMLQTSRPLRCILALILPSLAKPRKDEKDTRVISLGLHIVRNLLSIKDAVAEGSAIGEREEFASLQSSLILQLDKLTYFQLILTLASCADKTEFNQFNVLVLDILHLVYRSVKAKDLLLDQARAPMEKLSKLLELERRDKAVHQKKGMTRHSRFGTTVSVKADGQKLVLHKQNAISVSAGKILDDVKRKRAGKLRKVDELTVAATLTPDAMRVLQKLAKDFIESAFNTFTASILKDIRMERSKIRPGDNIRMFFLARFFVDYLLSLRAKEQAGANAAEASLAIGYVAEMAEDDTMRWVTMRMRWAMDERPPAWTELQACVECFTQILLLVEALSLSTEESDRAVAERLQDQLYYQADILDSALTVISSYKHQTIAYLDAIIHFAHVLLRSLEKYSKNNSFMFVRKRQAANAKRKAQEDAADIDAAAVPDEEEDEEDYLAHGSIPSYKEHAFTFQAYERRFAQEGCVNTFLNYLSRYQEFTEPEQMKHVVGLMHRQVVKAQAEGLYYKVSALQVFNQILEQKSSLPESDSSKDLLHLITFILRKFFKRVGDDPFLLIEAFTAKTRGHWKKLSSYQSDEESDGSLTGTDRRLKAPKELEFVRSRGLSWSQQMGAVVKMLLTAKKESWVKWIIEVMEVVHAQRQEIVLATDGPPEMGHDEDDDEADDETRARRFAPSTEALEKFAVFELETENEDQKEATTRNAHFRLMLKLLSFELEDNPSLAMQRWSLPATILPSSLSQSIGALRSFLIHPPDDVDLKRLLRTKRKRSTRKDLPDGSDVEDAPRRARKKKEETQIYKSAAFIDDSEDDAEADRRFFEREKALRAQMEEISRRAGGEIRSDAKKAKKSRKGKVAALGPGQESRLSARGMSDEDSDPATEADSEKDPDSDSTDTREWVRERRKKLIDVGVDFDTAQSSDVEADLMHLESDPEEYYAAWAERKVAFDERRLNMTRGSEGVSGIEGTYRDAKERRRKKNEGLGSPNLSRNSKEVEPIAMAQTNSGNKRSRRVVESEEED